MKERKDLAFRLNAFLSEAMRNQRSFSLEFKRQVVEELLSGESRSSQLYHRHRHALGLYLYGGPELNVLKFLRHR